MLDRLGYWRAAISARPGALPRWLLIFLATVAVAALLALSELELVVNGLLLGSTLALAAVGVSLIYGILRFGHIAHGDFMTLGAYIAFFFLTYFFPKLGLDHAGLGPFTFGYPLLLALPLSMLALSAVAIGLDRLVYRPLRARRAQLIVLMIASLGLGLVLRAVVQMLWGTQPEQYPRISRQFFHLPLDVRIPPDNIFLGLTSLVLVVGLYLLLTKTKIGKAMRATADNVDLARISGINTDRIIVWTWAVGASLAATAGTLLAVSEAQLLPILGWKLLIPIFAATILGGTGSLVGALVGGLIVGVSMEVSTEWILPSYKPAVAFAIMLLALLFRPSGLFGSRD